MTSEGFLKLGYLGYPKTIAFPLKMTQINWMILRFPNFRTPAELRAYCRQEAATCHNCHDCQNAVKQRKPTITNPINQP